MQMPLPETRETDNCRRRCGGRYLRGSDTCYACGHSRTPAVAGPVAQLPEGWRVEHIAEESKRPPVFHVDGRSFLASSLRGNDYAADLIGMFASDSFLASASIS